MPDMAAIQAAVGSLKMAGDIALGFMKLKSIAEVQGKVIELQGVILAAQSSALMAQTDQFALLERVRELEKGVADLKAWDTEKQRYQLEQVTAGTFAYVLKPEAKGAETPHWLCTNCYENGVKSVLQKRGQEGRFSTYTRARCKLQFDTSWSAKPQ